MPYGIFAFCLILFSLGSSIYLLVVHLQNRAIISGIALFLGSLGLWVTMTFAYMMEPIEYPKRFISDKKAVRVWRNKTIKNRIVGVKIGLALSAVSLLLSWYGGIYHVMARLGEGISYIVQYFRDVIWVVFGV